MNIRIPQKAENFFTEGPLAFQEGLCSVELVYIYKGKVVPVLLNWAQSYEGVLGEWRYSSTNSLTSVLDGSGQLHAPAALPPGKEPLVPIR
jgi:hypothetical protein